MVSILPCLAAGAAALAGCLPAACCLLGAARLPPHALLTQCCCWRHRDIFSADRRSALFLNHYQSLSDVNYIYFFAGGPRNARRLRQIIEFLRSNIVNKLSIVRKGVFLRSPLVRQITLLCRLDRLVNTDRLGR